MTVQQTGVVNCEGHLATTCHGTGMIVDLPGSIECVQSKSLYVFSGQVATVTSGLKSTASLVSTSIRGITPRIPSKNPRILHPMDCNADCGLEILEHYQAVWAQFHTSTDESAESAHVANASVKAMRQSVQRISNGYVLWLLLVGEIRASLSIQTDLIR
jgi:hypothetical protein